MTEDMVYLTFIDSIKKQFEQAIRNRYNEKEFDILHAKLMDLASSIFLQDRVSEDIFNYISELSTKMLSRCSNHYIDEFYLEGNKSDFEL